MNLFFLDRNPVTNAMFHHNKHVCKLTVELAQMLSTAHHILDESDEPTLYKATHKNHPTTKWVRSSLAAYQHTYDLFIALCNEYTHRYGKIHASYTKLAHILKNPPENIPTDVEWSDPPLAMPNEYKMNDAVESYRSYYIHEKVEQSTWKNRSIPYWIN